MDSAGKRAVKRRVRPAVPADTRRDQAGVGVVFRPGRASRSIPETGRLPPAARLSPAAGLRSIRQIGLTSLALILKRLVAACQGCSLKGRHDSPLS